MNRELSFRQRQDSGASMVELMDYYCLTDSEYDRVCASLAEIRKGVRK